jgi:CRP/FNR family transcriptional regulator, cyclic AMP receptor protein
MAKKAKKIPFDPKVFLAAANGGRSLSKYRKNKVIFSQGEPADSVFYIQKGQVKVTVVSDQGKEAIVAVLGPDEFWGEGCLTGQPRTATATAMTECEIMRLDKAAIIRVLNEEPAFSKMFVSHLLARTIRVEADLVDQVVQLERQALGAGPSAAGEFWQGRSSRTDRSEDQPRDTGGDDRCDPGARELFHEQVSKAGLD